VSGFAGLASRFVETLEFDNPDLNYSKHSKTKFQRNWN